MNEIVAFFVYESFVAVTSEKSVTAFFGVLRVKGEVILKGHKGSFAFNWQNLRGKSSCKMARSQTIKEKIDEKGNGISLPLHPR